MIFEWDEKKNRINKTKHRISFNAAKMVFFDPCCLIRFDRVEDDEDRWHAIRRVKGGLFFVVVHTTHFADQAEIIRIISARRPDRREKKTI